MDAFESRNGISRAFINSLAGPSLESPEGVSRNQGGSKGPNLQDGWFGRMGSLLGSERAVTKPRFACLGHDRAGAPPVLGLGILES